MLARTLNELTLDLVLQPRGPLLVKAGDEPTPAPLAAGEAALPQEVKDALGRSPADQMSYFQARKIREEARRKELKNRARDRREREKHMRQASRHGTITPIVEEPEPPDMRFVLTRHNGCLEPYLPGASLKGVLRTYAEQLARTMSLNGMGACNPFGKPGSADPPCWEDLGNPDAPDRRQALAAQVYRQHCPICKLFGSPFLAGRFAITDATLTQPPRPGALPRRDGVGIDRRRGAAFDGAKYDFEYWDGGSFQARLTLRNFELWQLGLLAHLLYALGAGDIAVGFGARRGLGRVAGATQNVQVTYLGAAALTHRGPALPLLGLAQLWPESSAYGCQPAEQQITLTAGIRVLTTAPTAFRRAWVIEQPDLLWNAVGPLWNSDTLDRLADDRRASLRTVQPGGPVLYQSSDDQLAGAAEVAHA